MQPLRRERLPMPKLDEWNEPPIVGTWFATLEIIPDHSRHAGMDPTTVQEKGRRNWVGVGVNREA